MQSNVSTFTDNVVIKQGTIDIRADKVVVTVRAEIRIRPILKRSATR